MRIPAPIVNDFKLVNGDNKYFGIFVTLGPNSTDNTLLFELDDVEYLNGETEPENVISRPIYKVSNGVFTKVDV